MPYDRELAERIRSLLPPGTTVTERAMFGGLAFMVDGTMAIAAGGGGAVMVRVDPAEAEELMAATGAVPMEMRGRPMRGWLQVATDRVGTRSSSRPWWRWAWTVPAPWRERAPPEPNDVVQFVIVDRRIESGLH